jgi:catechol 2,3-dioxygenase-like lactoylglutathione lyase family enzyme
MILISHIEINVTELEISVLFYISALEPLGFQRADFVTGNYARISNNKDTVIVLCQTEERFLCAAPAYHRKRVGLSHFALAVDTQELVDQMAYHLSTIGVPLLGQGKCEIAYRGGYYTLSFEDPDRIMIEIVCHMPSYFAL